MLHILKRHPIPMVGCIEQAVSLTYAFPGDVLYPMVSPGLELDTIEDTGFVAITTVRTCGLRPAFLQADSVHLKVMTPQEEANLQLTAEVMRVSGDLPRQWQSPFVNLEAARQFVAPLSHTFDHEPEAGLVIVVEGRRTHWEPQTLDVQVQTNTFFQSSSFRGSRPVLAGAFYLENFLIAGAAAGVRFQITYP